MGGFIGAAAAGLGAGLLGKKLDKGPTQVDRSRIPHRIETAGLVGGLKSPGNIRVDLTPERIIAGRDRANTFFRAADRLGGLYGDLNRSGLVDAGLARFQAARERSMSNLRSNLAKRKVLGSSFASNTLGATEAEFAQQEALFAAEQKQIETQQKIDLAQKEAAARAAGYQQIINDLDLPTEVGMRLHGTMSQVEATLAQVDAQMAAQHRGGPLELGLTAFSEAMQYGLGQQALTALGGTAGSTAGNIIGRSISGGVGYQPPVNPVTPGRVQTYGLATAPSGPSLSGAPLWGY